MKRADDAGVLSQGDEFVCEQYNEDHSQVERLAQGLPPEEAFAAASRLLGVCAEPLRTKLLYAVGETEMCVCELAELFGTSLSLTSHHLRALWKAGLIEPRKKGKLVYYSLRAGVMNGQLHAIVRSLVDKQTD